MRPFSTFHCISLHFTTSTTLLLQSSMGRTREDPTPYHKRMSFSNTMTPSVPISTKEFNNRNILIFGHKTKPNVMYLILMYNAYISIWYKLSSNITTTSLIDWSNCYYLRKKSPKPMPSSLVVPTPYPLVIYPLGVSDTTSHFPQ